MPSFHLTYTHTQPQYASPPPHNTVTMENQSWMSTSSPLTSGGWMFLMIPGMGSWRWSLHTVCVGHHQPYPMSSVWTSTGSTKSTHSTWRCGLGMWGCPMGLMDMADHTCTLSSCTHIAIHISTEQYLNTTTCANIPMYHIPIHINTYQYIPIHHTGTLVFHYQLMCDSAAPDRVSCHHPHARAKE